MKKFLVLLLLFTLSVRAERPDGEMGILAFGDFGTGQQAQKNVANQMVTYCKTHLCDLIIGLGDNFYPSGVSSVSDPKWQTHFETIYGALGLPFFAALGNHDYAGNVQAQIDYSSRSKIWKMPARYFSYTQGLVHFFVIDTEDFSEKQQDWLKDEVSNSTQPWKVVYGHKPIYSGGTHGSSLSLKKKLLPLIQNQTDLYVAGHDHDLQVIQDPETSPLFVVSGAAAQARPTKKLENSLYASDTLGFTHIFFRTGEATVTMVDITGKTLFTKTIGRRTK